MELSVINQQGKSVGRKIALPSYMYGEESDHASHVIYLDIKRYLSAQRQGTHKSKGRSEITGSVRKLRKQKGSGAARVGSIKNPIFRGGGRVFGPTPRDYRLSLNKKTKALARRVAFSHKVQQNEVIVVEDFTFAKPSTKAYATFLRALSVDEKRSVLVLGEKQDSLYYSSRNLPQAHTLLAHTLNTYDILYYDRILLFEQGLARLQTLWQ